MSEAQRNFAAILDILKDNGVRVTQTEHDHDYASGDLVSFTLTVEVNPWELKEYAENAPDPPAENAE